MKYLSLFSGIEACTVAWKPLGWECVAVAEIEPFPCAVLAHHYPDVPNLGDVTKITQQQIKDLGQIDLVVFGSPCQNLSVAGNRKGLQGESSGLFYEAIRLIQYAREHCGCRFALWENVPGAFSSNKGNDFREVVRELSANRDIETPKNGWGNTGVAVGENGLVEWRVLDAQYFGLAQRRKRVFAIVDFGDWTSRTPILLEPSSVRGNTPPSRETGKGVAQNAVSCLASGGEVVGTLQASAGDKQWLGNQKAFSGRFHIIAKATSEVGLSDVTMSLTASYGMGGCDLATKPLVVVHGSQDPISNTETANCLGRNNGLENVIAYSMIADTTPKISKDVCGTLRSQGGGGIVPPSVAYGFDSKQQMPQIEHEITQTLVATGYKEPLGVVAIAGNIIGRTDGNGGNHTGVDESGTCYTLTTADRHAVAVVAPTLTTNDPSRSPQSSEVTNQVSAVFMSSSVIRRLTPTECERLQGFPDSYTKIPYRKKSADDCPDGPRYKALGNSMAVPVMFWIGERIERAMV